MGEGRSFEEETPRPELLDLIKIDGRWAQFKGGIKGREILLFLDDGSQTTRDLGEYRLVRRFRTTVRDMKENVGEEMSKDEFERLHWGEQQTDSLKKEVTVFGEYEKK